MEGVAVMPLFVNSYPLPGTSSISPSNGEPFTTQFTFAISDWYDPEGDLPLTNSLSYTTTPGDYSDANLKIIADFSADKTWTFSMPVGTKEANYQI